MALIACEECKREISDQAQSCPHCGFIPKHKKNPFTKIIVYIVFFIGFISVFSLLGKPGVTPQENEQKSSTDSEHPVGQAEEIPAKKWEVSNYQDDVSGKQASNLSVISDNSVELEFPYGGGTVGNITIRKHPRFGLDAIVAINKGQLNCGVSSCSITVRFGDGSPQKFSVSEPSDHSNTVMFIEDKQRFINYLKSSDETVIELEFYSQGYRSFRFNTSEFAKNYATIVDDPFKKKK